MACKTVSFSTSCDLIESQLASLAKWLSCNGEAWGIGPTALFASASALFLYHHLETMITVPGDNSSISVLEKSLLSTMVLGMLALMIHVWVCSMRFFQYYLDTLIRDSPNVLLEMTTAGILGAQTELVPLGPITRFMKQQQPQIHITFCWFLSLCYADYVRKNYCRRFNMPFLEQWQADLHERASRGVRKTMERVNSFVGTIHQRLRGFVSHSDTNTGSAPCRACARNSDSILAKNDGREACLRQLTKSSETTADAIEKLRTYITATRCSCCGPQVTGICDANNTSPEDFAGNQFKSHGTPSRGKTSGVNIAGSTNPENAEINEKEDDKGKKTTRIKSIELAHLKTSSFHNNAADANPQDTTKKRNEDNDETKAKKVKTVVVAPPHTRARSISNVNTDPESTARKGIECHDEDKSKQVKTFVSALSLLRRKDPEAETKDQKKEYTYLEPRIIEPQQETVVGNSNTANIDTQVDREDQRKLDAPLPIIENPKTK